jgi:hypothetical protein
MSVQGTFDNSLLDKSGWHTLDLKASSAAASLTPTDMLTASFAAGVAEGILTCSEMKLFGYNMLVSSFGVNATSGDLVPPNADIMTFVESNDDFIQSMVSENFDTDEYWLAVGQMYAQLNGMLAGANDFSDCAKGADWKPFTWMELNLINLDGDLFDLQSAFPDSAGEEESPPKKQRHTERCSSLFKLTDDDVFFAHDTWDTYATAAPRIFKNVNIPVLTSGVVKMHTDSFSSSPGFLASVDDYYLLSGTSELTVIETSNDVFDKSAYDYLTPESVFCWARTMVANMLAVDNESWSDIFGEFHSGTYNNQWILLDASKFDAAADKATLKDVLWITEEAPGLMHAEDQTAKLVTDGYWGSYNVAYYEDIRERMGEMQSTEDAPRANLFRELQGSVKDIETMQSVMTWNDFTNDKYSLGRPSNAIMARDDLLKADARAAGGIDSKVSSLKARAGGKLTTFARCGPTFGGEDVPPFCWSGAKGTMAEDTPHAGHPDCFEYEFAAISPL